MGDPAGYQWSIEERRGEWLWSVRARDGQTSLVSGAALSRPHAAACVVRALIQGATSINHARMAA